MKVEWVEAPATLRSIYVLIVGGLLSIERNITHRCIHKRGWDLARGRYTLSLNFSKLLHEFWRLQERMICQKCLVFSSKTTSNGKFDGAEMYTMRY